MPIASANDSTSQPRRWSVLSFVLLSVLVLAYGLLNPKYNWDTIGYIASAEAISTDDPAAIHQAAYAAIRDHVSPAEFRALIDGNSYRRAMYGSPDFLAAQLPFYQIRPVYVFTLHLAAKLGVNIALATYLVSALFVIAAAGVIYLILGHMWPVGRAIYAPVVLLASQGLDLASLSTPDAMAYFGCLLAFYFLFTERIGAALLIAPALVLVRTDLILFSGFLWAWVLFFYPGMRSRPAVYLSAIIAVLLYVAVNRTYGNHGWAAVFYHTFVEYLADPANAVFTIGLADYLGAVVDGTARIVTKPKQIAHVLLAALCLYGARRLYRSDARQDRIISGLLVLSVGYLAIRYLAFPLWHSRFFAAEFAVQTIVFLRLALRLRPSERAAYNVPRPITAP